MSLIPGTYKFENNENYYELLSKSGLPEEYAKAANEEKPTLTIKVDGKKITWTYSGVKTVESILIDGQETEEKMTIGETILSTAKIEGNVLKIHSKDKKGKGEFTRVVTFSDSGLVTEITTGTGLKATRHFKRV